MPVLAGGGTDLLEDMVGRLWGEHVLGEQELATGFLADSGDVETPRKAVEFLLGQVLLVAEEALTREVLHVLVELPERFAGFGAARGGEFDFDHAAGGHNGRFARDFRQQLDCAVGFEHRVGVDTHEELDVEDVVGAEQRGEQGEQDRVDETVRRGAPGRQGLVVESVEEPASERYRIPLPLVPLLDHGEVQIPGPRPAPQHLHAHPLPLGPQVRPPYLPSLAHPEHILLHNPIRPLGVSLPPLPPVAHYKIEPPVPFHPLLRVEALHGVLNFSQGFVVAGDEVGEGGGRDEVEGRALVGFREGAEQGEHHGAQVEEQDEEQGQLHQEPRGGEGVGKGDQEGVEGGEHRGEQRFLEEVLVERHAVSEYK